MVALAIQPNEKLENSKFPFQILPYIAFVSLKNTETNFSFQRVYDNFY